MKLKSLLDRIVVVFAVQQNMLVTLRLDYPSDFPILTNAFQPSRLDKAQFMRITDRRSEDTNCRDTDRPCNFNTRLFVSQPTMSLCIRDFWDDEINVRIAMT